MTLKLKGAARKSSDDTKVPPAHPQSKPNLKSGAHWSDEYKRRMQADMDALTRRG